MKTLLSSIAVAATVLSASSASVNAAMLDAPHTSCYLTESSVPAPAIAAVGSGILYVAAPVVGAIATGVGAVVLAGYAGHRAYCYTASGELVQDTSAVMNATGNVVGGAVVGTANVGVNVVKGTAGVVGGVFSAVGNMLTGK